MTKNIKLAKNYRRIINHFEIKNFNLKDDSIIFKLQGASKWEVYDIYFRDHYMLIRGSKAHREHTFDIKNDLDVMLEFLEKCAAKSNVDVSRYTHNLILKTL